MDSLVPAFIAALLAGIGDRPARLAALLGARGGGGSVLAGFLTGHAPALAISVAGAIVIAPMLAPAARALLLAIALILAGLSSLWMRRPASPARGGRFVAAATGSFVQGDGTAFLAFALAVRGSSPVLAGIGALAGAMVVAMAATTMGRDWERLPLAWFARAAGAVLLITGIVVALSGLRLI